MARPHTPGNYRKAGSSNATNESKCVHVIVAEKALGKPLPKGAIVHHVNTIKDDNRNENLVICPDAVYHNLIHKRMRAYDTCGHADWLRCHFCNKYSDPSGMNVGKVRAAHKECASIANKSWNARKKARVAVLYSGET